MPCRNQGISRPENVKYRKLHVKNLEPLQETERIPLISPPAPKQDAGLRGPPKVAKRA